MFEVEDVNCICVNWLRGSLTLYDQASNNVRVVGAEIAYLIEVLEVMLDLLKGCNKFNSKRNRIVGLKSIHSCMNRKILTIIVPRLTSLAIALAPMLPEKQGSESQGLEESQVNTSAKTTY